MFCEVICQLPGSIVLIGFCKQKNVISFIMLLYSIMYDHHAIPTARPVAIPLRTVGLQRKSASSEIVPGGIGFYINFLAIHKGVSKNRGTPKSSILIGFSIIFTIHFGVPLFLVQHPCQGVPFRFFDSKAFRTTVSVLLGDSVRTFLVGHIHPF